MSNVNLECGQIKDFFESQDLLYLWSNFKKFQSHDGRGNDCHGVDQNHLGYLWFRKKVLDKINAQFSVESKLIFAMLLDCMTPFDIHHDIKPLPESKGKHWRSFLIPIAVDNDVHLVYHASTLIFNQSYSNTKEIEHAPDIENNISDLFKEKISHVDQSNLKKFSLRQELIWNAGDLLWWDSALCHVSNNFLDKGFRSKQAIVLHTYVV